MSLFDEEPVKKARIHEIGQDLSQLSVVDLSERIEQLRAEIARVEAERSAKDATKAAAESFFRHK